MTNPAIEIIAKTFADAEDAPTSFEDQNWLEGFEFARGLIAVRLSAELEKAGMIESASDFLDNCGIPENEIDCGQCEGTGTTDAMGYDEECPVCDGTGKIKEGAD